MEVGDVDTKLVGIIEDRWHYALVTAKGLDVSLFALFVHEADVRSVREAHRGWLTSLKFSKGLLLMRV